MNLLDKNTVYPLTIFCCDYFILTLYGVYIMFRKVVLYIRRMMPMSNYEMGFTYEEQFKSDCRVKAVPGND